MNMETLTEHKPNIHALSPEEKKRHFKKEFSKPSWFQKTFQADQKEFDCKEYYQLFRSEIKRILLKKSILHSPASLEQLGTQLSDEMKTYNFDDGVSKVSTFFYETDDQFIQTYFKFIKHYLQESLFKKPFFFQATPTLRIHCPNSKNSNHYPRYHTDIGYGHPPEEINLWLPLTELLEGHGFRLANVSDSHKILEELEYDFPNMIDKAIHDPAFTQRCHSVAPEVTTAAGKVLLFDSRCIHTGEPLKTHTRISMDIRILFLEDYENLPFEYQGLGRRRILFTPGHCYHTLSSDQLQV